MNSSMDFNELGAQVLEELKAGKPLFGKDGALAPLLENIINAALEGEMGAHLSEESRQAGNRRNGKMRKQVQTLVGEVTVSTPRDRDRSFAPQFMKKRETMLAEGMAEKIISMYALGTSTRAIGDWMEENPGSRVSPETISSITDRVLPEIKVWRSRSLDLVYAIVWMDAIHRQIRKVTKNKGVFPNDTALEKLVYLAYRNIRKKWTIPLANWAEISQQLAIKFGERFQLM